MRIALTVILTFAGSLLLSEAARADQAERPYVKLDCKDIDGDTGGPKFLSRDACYAQAKKNKVMFANLKTMLVADVHDQESNLIARNNKHVVMAYAALWILAASFLLLLFLRQSRLTAEIRRLQRELARAVKNEEEEE